MAVTSNYKWESKNWTLPPIINVSKNNPPQIEMLNDDLYQKAKYFMGFFTCIIIIISIIGNSLVLIAVGKTKSLQRMNNSWYVSLAAADLIRAAICMPIFVVMMFSPEWSPPEEICPFYHCLHLSLGVVTIFNLTAISIDRVFVITRPLVYQRVVTTHKMVVCITCLWIVSFTYGFLQLLWWLNPPTSPDSSVVDLLKERLYSSNVECSFQTSLTFSICDLIITFAIPLIIMMVAYAKIFKVVHGQMRRLKRRVSEVWDDGDSDATLNFTHFPIVNVTSPTNSSNAGGNNTATATTADTMDNDKSENNQEELNEKRRYSKSQSLKVPAVFSACTVTTEACTNVTHHDFDGEREVASEPNAARRDHRRKKVSDSTKVGKKASEKGTEEMVDNVKKSGQNICKKQTDSTLARESCQIGISDEICEQDEGNLPKEIRSCKSKVISEKDDSINACNKRPPKPPGSNGSVESSGHSKHKSTKKTRQKSKNKSMINAPDPDEIKIANQKSYAEDTKSSLPSKDLQTSQSDLNSNLELSNSHPVASRARSFSNPEISKSELPILQPIKNPENLQPSYSKRYKSSLRRKDSLSSVNITISDKRRMSVQFQLYDSETEKEHDTRRHSVSSKVENQQLVQANIESEDPNSSHTTETTAIASTSTASTTRHSTSKFPNSKIKSTGKASERHTQVWASRHFNVDQNFSYTSGTPRPSIADSFGSGATWNTMMQRRRKSLQRFKENKASKMTAAVIGAFVLCWLPYEIVFVVKQACDTCIPDIAWIVVNTLAYSSSSLNPFIYNFYSSEFRRAVRRVLCCRDNHVGPWV